MKLFNYRKKNKLRCAL